MLRGSGAVTSRLRSTSPRRPGALLLGPGGVCIPGRGCRGVWQLEAPVLQLCPSFNPRDLPVKLRFHRGSSVSSPAVTGEETTQC